jgi:hypothetical protein
MFMAAGIVMAIGMLSMLMVRPMKFGFSRSAPVLRAGYQATETSAAP